MNISEISGSANSYLHKLESSNALGASSSVKGSASANTLFAQIQNDIQINSKDFKALKAALKTNNLTAANQAYTALQQDFQNIPTVAGVQSPLDPSTAVGKDFKALGTALQTGNLASAQSALATFQQDMISASALKGLYQDGVAAVNANSSGQSSGSSSILSKLGLGA
jgi:hypothetical protein